MAKQLVRIKCRPDDREEHVRYEIVLEAVIEDGFLCAMYWFGLAQLDGDRWFFVLETNGRIDFGTGFGEADRYWTTTLNRRAIRAGETFSIKGTDEWAKSREVLYAIFDVQPVFRDSQ